MTRNAKQINLVNTFSSYVIEHLEDMIVEIRKIIGKDDSTTTLLISSRPMGYRPGYETSISTGKDLSPESDDYMIDPDIGMAEITELSKKTDEEIMHLRQDTAAINKENAALSEEARVLVSNLTDEFVVPDHPRKKEFKEFLLQLIP